MDHTTQAAMLPLAVGWNDVGSWSAPWDVAEQDNQSTCIPLGVEHRLENPGQVPQELIEVQSGSDLGEDDIVRFEDFYGRG